jgi:type IV secretory pathway VirB10-like protein
MEINQSSLDQFDEFLLKPRGDKLIRINISRNTLIAFIFSLLIHALVLLVVLPRINFDNAASPQPSALEVSLALPVLPKVEVPVLPKTEPAKPEPKVIKSPPKVMTQKPSKNTKPADFSVPEIISTREPTLESPPPKETKPNDAPTDMASYVKAQQAKRNAQEVDAARQNAEAVAREVGPSQEQIRDERIKNNFKNGTNGIFEITSLSGRHAAFSFKGWTNDYSNAKRESFEVEASVGQDVRLLMIRRMISLIRRHYDGDFNWESERLHREIIKSARLEDSAELEEFMMMEFFGTNYKNQ